MTEITKPTKGTKYIMRFFAIFLAIALLVTLVVWLMSCLPDDNAGSSHSALLLL